MPADELVVTNSGFCKYGPNITIIEAFECSIYI